MNADSYKIIISISHHRIAFEYWQRDGENKLMPLPNGNWPAPLAFYCSDTGIVIGDDAVRAANSGTTNAFVNYFERLADDTSYNIGGQTRPIRNLLLDAAESIFRDFFREVLFNRLGSLSDNRANMPLTIVCESDIKPNEKVLLQDLFKDSGYNRVRVVNYDRYINRYINRFLAREYVCDKVVVAWAEDTDLTFSIFGVNNDTPPIVKSFENLGIDPRKKYVEDLIWECIIAQNQWFQRANEADTISKAASDFLTSSQPLISDSIILSDGHPYRYTLNRNSIDYIRNADGVGINHALEQFLKENGIDNRSRTLLLLRGIAAGNSYFEQNLRPGFTKVIKSDKQLRDNTMQLIITEEDVVLEPIIPPPPVKNTPGLKTPPPSPLKKDDVENPTKIKELHRKWRQVKAEANGKQRSGQTQAAIQMLKDFLAECQTISGVDMLIAEVDEYIAKYNLPPQTPADQNRIKALERKWREIKAEANGKSRSGNPDDAKSMLQAFLKSVEKEAGSKDLVDSIKKEISLLAPGDSNAPKPGYPGSNTRQYPNPGAGRASAPTDAGSRTSNPPRQPAAVKADNEGEALIAQGNLKGARDWYRSHNNPSMAAVLSDIIRSQRGMEIRKTTIEEYRKSKNRVQINRIITEIQEYLNLCLKAGVDSSEYKRLLAEYRKIQTK